MRVSENISLLMTYVLRDPKQLMHDQITAEVRRVRAEYGQQWVINSWKEVQQDGQRFLEIKLVKT